jgi:8-oxo-dGTP pyrophosphatase MutT (NUDIX family)
LVHKYNILHRGVGIFITKDHPIKLSSTTSTTDVFASLYVHQRVATKRIFPSLYDMFIGGVSEANEPSWVTAQREVAEELGLKGNTLPPQSITSWSVHNHDCRDNELLTPQPLFTCLVCTAYNRCLVDLFQYTCDTTSESVQWQAEEVSWGDFVPYEDIVKAADWSMKRFNDAGTWPGGQGYFPVVTDSDNDTGDNDGSTIEQQQRVHAYDGNIEDWDFVPDGLLVWRAWLDFINRSNSS